MRIATAAILSTMLLAACDEKEAAPQPAASASPQETGYIAKVKALDPALLNGVLYRAINDAKLQCQQVKTSSETKTNDGQPAWIATCDNRTRYIVILFDDGNARVTPAPAG